MFSGKPYDKTKVGRLIAWGSDHVVYDSEEDKVIKFSLLESLHGKHGKKKIIQDYLLCKSFFGDYVLETEIKSSLNSKKVALIQPKISGHFLSKSDLKDQSILTQFREILSAHDTMINEGYPELDFIGQKGFFKNSMSNIFVTKEGKLLIIDTTLLEFSGMGFLHPFFYLVCNFAKWYQKYLIRKFVS